MEVRNISNLLRERLIPSSWASGIIFTNQASNQAWNHRWNRWKLIWKPSWIQVENVQVHRKGISGISVKNYCNIRRERLESSAEMPSTSVESASSFTIENDWNFRSDGLETLFWNLLRKRLDLSSGSSARIIFEIVWNTSQERLGSSFCIQCTAM